MGPTSRTGGYYRKVSNFCFNLFLSNALLYMPYDKRVTKAKGWGWSHNTVLYDFALHATDLIDYRQIKSCHPICPLIVPGIIPECRAMNKP